jgi:ketosteroid isomerase-like protein
MSIQPVTGETLDKLRQAFGTLDLDAVMNAFADDGEFVNARGSTPFGDAYVGKRDVRRFFADLFKNSPNLTYEPLEPDWVFGNKAVFRWRRRAARDGKLQDWVGCDLLTFDGQLVKRKDTFFKIVEG